MSDDREPDETPQAERDAHELRREREVIELAKIVRRRVDRVANEDETPLPPAA